MAVLVVELVPPLLLIRFTRALLLQYLPLFLHSLTTANPSREREKERERILSCSKVYKRLNQIDNRNIAS
uniref:Putative secreted protein n=1 Tax=Anopheles darlingi TaxID=43151 RepID=A0A2M4DM77_ANODA